MDASSNRTLSIWWPRVAILIAVAIGLFFCGKLGVRFRHWVWDTTASIRFVPDIDRGYAWGRRCATEGFLNQYEKMQPEQPGDEDWLDYAPLRLGVMALWGKWSLVHFPHVDRWHDDQSYALTAPVLRFNLTMETVGVVCAFFLTRLWANRRNPMARSDSLHYFFRGCVPGLVASLLLWFNPAIAVSAYGWPTWDLWIIPIFLLAALLASMDWWFTAGIVLGIGAMLKGQQLIAVPVFVIWSLMLGRPLSALRLCGGVVMAIGLIVSPWLLTYIPPSRLAEARAVQAQYGQVCFTPDGTFRIDRAVDTAAVFWIFCVLLAAVTAPWVAWIIVERPGKWGSLLASPWTWRAIAATTVVVLIGWPWLLARNRAEWLTGLQVTAVMIAAVLMTRPGGIVFVTATAVGIALLLCMSVFHGSSGWYDCGLHYGTVHWQKLIQGSADNLPALLQEFGWPNNQIDITVFEIPARLLWHHPVDAIEVSVKTVLLTLFWTTLTLSSIGLGMHARRCDSRVLISLTAPWLMFFCFPPQIHERYLLYAAAISSICAGVSTGMVLLGVCLSLLTMLMTLHVMFGWAAGSGIDVFGKTLAREFPWLLDGDVGQKLVRLAIGMHPDMGYAVVLCTLIFLYFSLAPRRKHSDSAPVSGISVKTQ